MEVPTRERQSIYTWSGTNPGENWQLKDYDYRIFFMDFIDAPKYTLNVAVLWSVVGCPAAGMRSGGIPGGVTAINNLFHKRSAA
ncbi:MAG: hypothetical protein ABFD97_05265 [Syntrophobacter sp.]